MGEMAVAAPPPGRPSAAQEALTYTRIALIFFIIFFALWLVWALIDIVTWIGVPYWWRVWGWLGLWTWFIFKVIWAFLSLFAYFYIRSRVYLPLLRGDVHAAHSACVVGIILGFIFGGVIPGILLLLAYMKLGEAVAAPPPAPPPPPPPPPAPATTS